MKAHHFTGGMPGKKHQAGISIVELMIALLLSMVLMAGAIQVFISSKSAFAFNEEMTWLQEGSRFTMEFLTRDARMAGYFGCGSQSVANTLKPATASDAWKYNFDEGIVGYDGDDAANFPSDFPEADLPTLSTGALPKSDAITILRGATDGDLLTVTGHNVNAAVISVSDVHGFPDGRVLVVSDCDHAAIFQTTGGNPKKLGHNKGKGSPGNCTKGLGLPVVCTANGTAYKYGGDASVMEVVTHAYYVDTASNGVPSMYRQRVTGGEDVDTEELAQGIENIQVFFGVDTNDDKIANKYVIASDVTDWKEVMSVRFHILARSISGISTEPVNFRFIGNTYTPTDNYLRKEFISTVKIRNRGV